MKNIPPIIRLGSVDSTNTYIRNHPELWDRQFCAVTAREQTGGRGRFDRKWISGPGLDLAFSMVYLPSGDAADPSCITLLAGLAVHRALRHYCGPDLNLKWPNDIRCMDKKIGGILCEMVLAPERTVVIIGIGININRTDFPNELVATATSLKIATGTNHSIEEIFNDIHHHCIRLLSDFRIPLAGELIMEWAKASQSIGSPVRFVLHDRAEEGVLSAINTDGSLCIIKKSGTTIDGYLGEVLFPDDE